VDLNLEDRHLELARIARQLFESRCSLERVRALEADDTGYSPELWQEMAGLDWLGLGYPRDWGGSGGGLLDLAMIYREMGRALVPSPHLASAVICGQTLVGEANAARAGLVASMTEGDMIVTPALMEGSAEYGPDAIHLSARATGHGFALQGTKLLVPYAHVAGSLLVAARTGTAPDGVTLFLVDAHDPSVSAERMPNIAGYPLFAVTFDSLEVGADAVVGEVDHGWEILGPALDRATVLRCAEIVGAGERLLDMSVGYAQQRAQFGRPIGQFQAVQYLCTDIAIDTHLTSLLTWQAAWLVDNAVACRREVAMAKAYGSRAAQRIVHRAHEVHAGVGFMMETDLQLFTRRAKHWEFDLGEARYHDDAIAAALEN
jgi:alkylation response protein AidB-like acyl-CoA dehydrogenase